MFVVLEFGCPEGRQIAVVVDQPEAFATELAARPEFDSLVLVDTLPSGRGLNQALERLLAASDAALIAVLANPDLVFDAELPDRLCRAAAGVPDLDRLAVVTAKGVDMWGNPYSGLYASLEPHLPFCRSPVPVVDSAPDFFLISRSHLIDLLARSNQAPASSFAAWAVIEGYLAGRISYHSPHLAAGIYGHHLAREAENHAIAIAQLIQERVMEVALPSLDGTLMLGHKPPSGGAAREWRLAPRVDLERAIRDAILPHCHSMTLSIVTRTQFSRPHLLRRLLTSLSRWRVDGMDLQVVLSTDVDRELAERELDTLRTDFPMLRLDLAWNGDRKEKSRVRNLLGGLEQAAHDYVAFVDDDDHVHFQALSVLALTRFMDAMPLVFMDTELRNEKWVRAANERWMLESTSFHHNYAGAGWRSMFKGVNQLPICAAILPRVWATEITRRFRFRHDYSEDFTLWLLLLQAQDLPLIVDIPQSFCIVSIRNDGTNTVTEQDRSRWVRDISLFLHDLQVSQPLHGEGRLQLAVLQKPASGNDLRPDAPDGRARMRREVAMLRAENERLRAWLGQRAAAGLLVIPEANPAEPTQETPVLGKRLRA